MGINLYRTFSSATFSAPDCNFAALSVVSQVDPSVVISEDWLANLAEGNQAEGPIQQEDEFARHWFEFRELYQPVRAFLGREDEEAPIVVQPVNDVASASEVHNGD